MNRVSYRRRLDCINFVDDKKLGNYSHWLVNQEYESGETTWLQHTNQSDKIAELTGDCYNQIIATSEPNMGEWLS